MSDSPPSGSPPPPPPGSSPPPPPGSGGGYRGGGAGSGSLDLGAAFTFGWAKFQEHLTTLLVAVAIYFVVIFGVGLVWQLIVGGMFGSGDPANVSGSGLLSSLAVSTLGSFVFTIGGYIVQAVLVRAGFDLVDGRGLDTGRLFDTSNLGAIIITGLLVSVGTTIGLVLCVLPGILFAIISGYSFHFVIDEGKAPVEAIRASIDLYRENPGSALLLWIATAVVSFAGILLCVVGVVVSFPVALIAQAHGFRQLRGRAPATA